ncbi:MAG: hypothetical protein H7844_10415 [Nitrospirae bacterium YQR-1]
MKKQHPLRWIFEPLEAEPSYIEKHMFGCLACYLYGKIALVISSGEEPWNGLLIPTEKQYHQSIIKEFDTVVQHPVLKKWLYLPEETEDFESAATLIAEIVLRNDPRFGVYPKERKSKDAHRLRK